MPTTIAPTPSITDQIQSQVSSNSHGHDIDALFTSLPSKNLEPLWLKIEKFVPPTPNPAATVALWPYAEIRPTLIDAGRFVSAEEAERRVLMLVNPTLQAPHTTDTIYGGLQIILPGEIAPAHRHTAFALRFIVEGSCGFTAIDGQKVMMERGDIILTPSWNWHDHGNEGTEPVIWLDGLDLPVFGLFHLNFATAYPEPRYPSTISDNCKLQFPWNPVEKALRATIGSYARYHYRLDNGQHLSRTLSVQAERVNAGMSSPESQETVSFMYHVVKGEGYSTIITPDGDHPVRITWSSKDTFAVPAWSRITHTCTMSQDDAFLIAMNDRPMVESLGLLRDGSSLLS